MIFINWLQNCIAIHIRYFLYIMSMMTWRTYKGSVVAIWLRNPNNKCKNCTIKMNDISFRHVLHKSVTYSNFKSNLPIVKKIQVLNAAESNHSTHGYLSGACTNKFSREYIPSLIAVHLSALTQLPAHCGTKKQSKNIIFPSIEFIRYACHVSRFTPRQFVRNKESLWNIAPWCHWDAFGNEFN